ncbi:signal peptidase II [Halanaerobium hydrogeniformans]|uniref:Lipoprotein signal peptidase n=1 Tax=Halanaerobium hydrogeniformans TaxID=656519 RepID=E4RLV4_HALHG|nr:signal peptidase II [Halanaerobium hydrogeniformans]ADQ15018.1 lipoprotein signal peptidase [Halanaerobium hydrogeniformans]
MWIAIFSSLIIFLDQITKFLIRNHLIEYQEINIITEFLSLRFIKNKGAAFGILEGQRYFFIIVTFLFYILIYYLYKKELSDHWTAKSALIFLLGGSVGNLIDRIAFHYVIDFIAIANFPVFNFADIFIFFGILLLLINLLFIEN